VTATADADRLFALMYGTAGIGESEGGFIFMERILTARASPPPEA